MWALVALPLVAAFVVWWIGRSGLLRVRGADPSCAACRYPADAPVCPECGCDLTTPGSTMTVTTRRTRWAFVGALSLLVVADLLLAALLSDPWDRTLPSLARRSFTSYSTNPMHWEFECIRTDDGFQCVHLGRLGDFVPGDDHVVYAFTEIAHDVGLLIPVARSRHMLVTSGNRDADSDEALLAMIESEFDPEVVLAIRAGLEDRTDLEPIWSGIAHDLCMLLTLVLALRAMLTWNRAVGS